jgi:C-terminal peptidase prc
MGTIEDVASINTAGTEAKGPTFMFRTRIAGLLGVVIVALLVSPALVAEEPKQKTQARVVLIGISEYADKQIKARKHAEDDARALYDLFTSKDYLGVDSANIRLLLGKEDEKRKSIPATRKNILEALEWLARESNRDDLTLIAFIGEGGPLGDKSDRRCYFASDSTFKERHKTAVAIAEVEERLNKLKSRKFCAFVDVNFKGFLDKTVLEPVLGATPYREFLGDDGSDEHNFQPGRTIFLATNGLSVSLDLKEHGLLTQVLLAGLKGDADKYGYEPDGVVTIGELTTYVNKELPKLAREHGKTLEEKAQLHHILGERTGEMPLTTNPAVIGKVRERLRKLEQLLADKKITEKLAEEGRKLLSRMPHLKAQQELRKEYQHLVDGDITSTKLEERRTAILASTKLDPDVAETFATQVLKGMDLVLKEYVKEVEKGDLVASAIRGLYRRVNEKIPPALNEKLGGAKKLSRKELQDLLVEARMALGKREDLDGQKDIDIAVQRMMGDLKDPHSVFIDPQMLEQFKKGTEGKYIGIGVSIRKDVKTDNLLVITPLPGSPAYKAGIRAGDLITSVTLEVDRDGKPLDKPEVVQMRGMNVNDAVKKITGKPGTKLKVTIERPGEDKARDIELKREPIVMETVMGYKRNAKDGWDFMLDPEQKIGYIRLTQFTDNSATEMEQAVAELKKQGMKALVLDLRFNPGGKLVTAVKITDLFVDDGLIVSIRPRKGKEEKYEGESAASELRFPMACLINGGSASGSEILSAALQDQGRALIVGERSYGKGSVQDVVKFAGGEMKLTTASFWRPNGKNLNKASTKGRDEDEWGVLPDKGYEVKLSSKETEDLEEALKEAEIINPKDKQGKKNNPDFKDRQLNKATEYLLRQIKLADKLKSLKDKEAD